MWVFALCERRVWILKCEGGNKAGEKLLFFLFVTRFNHNLLSSKPGVSIHSVFFLGLNSYSECFVYFSIGRVLVAHYDQCLFCSQLMAWFWLMTCSAAAETAGWPFRAPGRCSLNRVFTDFL